MTNYNQLTDQQLWELFKSQDNHAYAEIYERYFGLLYSHARKRLTNPQDAEDVIQELFVCLWSKSREIHINLSLRNYLFGCVRNRIFNHLSRSNFQEKYRTSLSLSITFEAETDHLVRERQLADLIKKEIDALPAKMKAVFLMSREDHLTYLEIADKLQITEQSVRSHVKNALRVLKVRLGIIVAATVLFWI